MKKHWILLLLITALFSSCEEMVTTIDVPGSESHYVLHSYLSPEDSVVMVLVNRSTPVFGEQTSLTDTSWITHVKLYINGFELPRQTWTEDQNGNFKFQVSQSLFPILPGETYKVELKIDGVTECSGSCTIPLQTNQSMVFSGYDSTHYLDDEYYSYYAIYSFIDAIGEGNFYRVGAELGYIDSWSGDSVWNIIYPEVEYFMKDIDHDGQEISGRIFYYYDSSRDSVTSLKLTLYTTDEIYYNYHRAILSQNGDDPFSEPVIVPTNIENGLGCVAAYRKFTVTVL
ncbi:MAG: hypothetical protein CVU11_10270 [Bacteroidetes bacterium HGW-Bacteroidetes-6]|nr:MAG: hypothetical protein CVU11_10270 [Bacteroidetes bacterium HGW-Bacteroidetes-6]